MSGHEWQLFRGEVKSENAKNQTSLNPDPIQSLLNVAPPSWRSFNKIEVEKSRDQAYWKKLLGISSPKDIQKGQSFCVRASQSGASTSSEQETTDTEQAVLHSDVLDAVNAALYLRRPLLVTGRPGAGKTSLAYAIAYELKLGPVLLWPITARSNLQEGLYQYDAISRLQDAQLNRPTPEPNATSPQPTDSNRNIGQYIRLGPVGTAFLPSNRPRVLLIDEIDKSDINLPNELLNLFEEGEFDIPELVRLSKQGDKQQQVQSYDGLDVMINEGKISCGAFPFIIMTSNGERDFPPAFYRRCLRVEMPSPTVEDLRTIVRSHLNEDSLDEAFESIIRDFAERSSSQAGGLATDQLLNTVYLMKQDADLDMLKRLIFTPLSNTGTR